MIDRDSHGVYRYRLSETAHDPAWDTFLARTVGGHHVQTSLWAQVKATRGWRASRIVVADQGELVGGAQLLVRSLPLAGAIGYVPKGPVIARDDPALVQLILRELQRLAREQRIVHLTVQPPNAGIDVVSNLLSADFTVSETEVAPTASVQLDLEPDLDTILSRMKKNHRRYIRHGLRQGMVGRIGTRADFPKFYQLLTATANRQDFMPYPMSYFEKIWDLMHPSGNVQLFLTEYEGEAVSAQLCVGFGDTVITKNSGWTGEYSNLGPNHVLEWTAIKWAKSCGYKTYDLEGIDAAAGRMIDAGQSLTPEMRQRPFFWKLGFGGDVVLFPQAYVLVPTRPLRKIYSSFYPQAARWPVTAKLVSRFRTG